MTDRPISPPSPAETPPKPDLVPFHRSVSCNGEQCTLCGRDADLKVGEEIMHDDPHQQRHNFTAYVCLEHANRLFFPYLFRSVRDPAPTETQTATPEPLGMRRSASALIRGTLEFLDLPHNPGPDWLRALADTYRASVLADTAPLPNDDDGLPAVGGEMMDRSIADFRRACRVLLMEEQERANPNTALIAVLCDAVRCSRELVRAIGPHNQFGSPRAAQPATTATTEAERKALTEVLEHWSLTGPGTSEGMTTMLVISALLTRLRDNPTGKPDLHVAPSRDQTPELTPEWCTQTFYLVNPGASSTMPQGVPSLYLLDFARAVLAEFSDLKETPPHG